MKKENIEKLIEENRQELLEEIDELNRKSRKLLEMLQSICNHEYIVSHNSKENNYFKDRLFLKCNICDFVEEVKQGDLI